MHAMNRPTQNTPIWISSSCVSFGVGERPRHHAERRGGHRQEDVAPVPARAVEAEDERQQVERQRHDPQQRHRRDVLRDVVRHREQQQRAGRGERAPEHLARDRRRRLDDAAHSQRRVAGADSGRGRRAQAREARPRCRARRRARSRPTSPTPARASRSTARAGTDSRAARASTRGSTARTAGTGCDPGSARANHACTSGLVVDSRKYGRPMVAASRPRISHDGILAARRASRTRRG